jgi:chitodextrinase
MSASVVNGVSLRIAPDLTSYVQSALVDAKPITQSLDDAPLRPGAGLTDPVSGINVYVQEISPWKAQVQITLPSGGTAPPGPSDASAPTAASGLTSTASDATSVQLTWAASADNVGVGGYWVYRDGRVVGSPTGTTFTDDTAGAESSYVYAVRAYDAAGNVGPESAQLAVTTPADAPDTTPPTTPARLNAVISTLVHLWWDASYDARGLSAYVVYRDGVALGTTSSQSFSDLSVQGGRAYTYSVRARDRAGNLGGAAVVLVTLPSAPVAQQPIASPLPNPPAARPSTRRGDWAGERGRVSVRNGRLPRHWLRGAVRPGRR